MKEVLAAAVILFVSSSALADGWKWVIQSRIEYKKTYNAEKKYAAQGEFNLRAESKVTDHFKTGFWMVPRFRMTFGNWKMGPELRLPVAGTKDYKLLLQAEFNIDKWQRK